MKPLATGVVVFFNLAMLPAAINANSIAVYAMVAALFVWSVAWLIAAWPRL